MRCDEKLELFWKDILNKATNLRIDPPKLPKGKKTPSRIEECLGGNAASEFDKVIASYCRKNYYEAMDCITNAFTDRFDQQDFKPTSNWKTSRSKQRKEMTSYRIP